jgi:predicted proteasome-type protease
VVITERRSEPRERVDRYFSVEFVVGGTESIYQFRIWDLSSQGMCVLVKSDSDLVKHLKVGLTLDMKYHHNDISKPADYLKTEIRHITRDVSGRFKDHFLVGLSILGGRGST